MTWQVVARKDFRDAVRSWWLWGLSALFVVFFSVPAYFFADRVGGAVLEEEGVRLTSDQFIGLLAEITAFFIPIIAIVIAYAAIAGERDSGTLKLLLSLPHSRRDIVVGKIVGRGAVVALPVLIGFAAGAIVFLLTPVTLELGNYVLFALLSAVLGVVFVAIAVGVSAAADTSRQAMIGVVAIFVTFALLWGRFASGLVQILSNRTGIATEVLLELQLFVRLLNPMDAYTSIAAILWTEESIGARISLFGQFEAMTYAELLDPLPVYFSDPVVIALFLAWLVVPPVVGLLVFEDVDL